MNSKKNIIVVSARRSGTHLLHDLIVNNFGYESTNYNYIAFMPIEAMIGVGSAGLASTPLPAAKAAEI